MILVASSDLGGFMSTVVSGHLCFAVSSLPRAHCELKEECALAWVDTMLKGLELGRDATDPSELVLEFVKLGGREARCDDIDDDRDCLLLNESALVASDLTLVSDKGRRNETVRDLLSAMRSIFSSSSTCFLTSGSLYSSFPFLSDAKYSSPRPNTT